MAQSYGSVGVSQRVAETTISEWAREVSEETSGNFVVLAKLKARGRIEKDCHGVNFRWPVRNRRHTLKGFQDNVALDFTRKNTKTRAYLDWAGYYSTEAITLREKAENGGKEAFLKVFQGREELVRQGLMEELAGEFYQDGTAYTDVPTPWTGLEAMMGYSTQTATDHLASIPSDTYAGLSTILGTVGGSTTDSVLKRLWTPAIVNCVYNPGAGVRSWANYGDEHIRHLVTHTRWGKKATTDLVLCDKDSFEDLKNLLDDKEQIRITRGEDLETVKLGFKDFIGLDGVEIGWDEACPITDGTRVVHGYGFACDKMKLKLLGQSQIWLADIDWNNSMQADEIALIHQGQLQFESPRCFGALKELTP